MPIAYIAILFHWHIDTSLLFYLVQHLQCRLDSSLRLVCIKTTCFKVHSCIIPTNDSLHKGIGPSAGWYRNGIISQHRERTAQIGIYALGKTSGKANIRKNLEALGIDIDENSMRKVTERIIELGDKKEMVTTEDLPYIISDVLHHDTMADQRIRILNYSLLK